MILPNSDDEWFLENEVFFWYNSDKTPPALKLTLKKLWEEFVAREEWYSDGS